MRVEACDEEHMASRLVPSNVPDTAPENPTSTLIRMREKVRMWSSNPSGKCSFERPTWGTVCGTMRSMCGADAGCLAIHYNLPTLMRASNQFRRVSCYNVKTMLTNTQKQLQTSLILNLQRESLRRARTVLLYRLGISINREM